MSLAGGRSVNGDSFIQDVTSRVNELCPTTFSSPAAVALRDWLMDLTADARDPRAAPEIRE